MSTSVAHDTEKWMLPQELSAITGMSLDRLKNLRYLRQMFPFYKVPGTRVVLYDRAEVNKIISESRIEVRP